MVRTFEMFEMRKGPQNERQRVGKSVRKYR